MLLLFTKGKGLNSVTHRGMAGSGSAELPAILGTLAKSLYQKALENGELDLAADAPETPASSSAAEELLSFGLLDPAPRSPGRFLPVDPRVAEARIGSAWRTRALRLLDQAADFSDELAPFIERYRSPAGRPDPGPGGNRFSGAKAINIHLGQALDECREELLTAQPGGGRPSGLLREAVARDQAVLRRGASMRTLYQHSARFDAPTRDYVSDVSALGAQVRTLDEFFERLIVVDRKVAFIPAPDNDDDAVIIKDEAVVRYLADVFDRSWQRATEFPVGPDGSDVTAAKAVSNELRASIVRLLIEGECVSTIARRVGLSQRNCATHLAKLKQQLGAETLFQLGFRVAESGLYSVGSPAGSDESSA
ncbi:helix-turn-helix domain-containing protein [Streptomyces sp. ISL-98]|uniref:helix-turn-helix domain-containing protein n=1 Tax=Streptomyces sp. ISL-98 TaxID=2819192 RepID=UPI001BE74EDE|nr:helix-turn-helix domain-containing protein [Streptomyces sp. ISL-98]MBT2506916.1 helix-turn-helix domain-containing protein [Streptomyces sp. ISL-98]